MSRIPEYKKLPENFDPKDPALKIHFNPKADDLNYISTSRKHPYLACGATKKNKQTCGQPAGFGTKHVGYGRCKHHGGCSTGPKTEEGKAAIAKNGVIHGLYRSALMPYERDLFDEFANQDIGLEFEINMMKTKILSYLNKNAEKWQKAYQDKLAHVKDEQRAADHADRETRVWYTTVSDDGSGGIESIGSHYYHGGTIEDKPLIRALETLGRLVDKHAKLKGLDKTDAENILDGINKELRAASHGQVSISWGGGAQQRKDKTEE